MPLVGLSDSSGFAPLVLFYLVLFRPLGSRLAAGPRLSFLAPGGSFLDFALAITAALSEEPSQNLNQSWASASSTLIRSLGAYLRRLCSRSAKSFRSSSGLASPRSATLLLLIFLRG